MISINPISGVQPTFTNAVTLLVTLLVICFLCLGTYRGGIDLPFQVVNLATPIGALKLLFEVFSSVLCMRCVVWRRKRSDGMPLPGLSLTKVHMLSMVVSLVLFLVYGYLHWSSVVIFVCTFAYTMVRKYRFVFMFVCYVFWLAYNQFPVSETLVLTVFFFSVLTRYFYTRRFRSGRARVPRACLIPIVACLAARFSSAAPQEGFTGFKFFLYVFSLSFIGFLLMSRKRNSIEAASGTIFTYTIVSIMNNFGFDGDGFKSWVDKNRIDYFIKGAEVLFEISLLPQLSKTKRVFFTSIIMDRIFRDFHLGEISASPTTKLEVVHALARDLSSCVVGAFDPMVAVRYFFTSDDDHDDIVPASLSAPMLDLVRKVIFTVVAVFSATLVLMSKMTLEQYNQKIRNAKSISFDVVEGIGNWSTVYTIVQRIIGCFSAGSFSPLADNVQYVAHVHSRLDVISLELDNIPLRKQSDDYRPAGVILNELKDMKSKLLAMRTDVFFQSSRNSLDKLIQQLETLETRTNIIIVAGDTRPTPLGVLLVGPPKCGKSTFVTRLHNANCVDQGVPRDASGRYPSSARYNISSSSKFCDSLTNSVVTIVFDDMGSKLIPAGGEDEMLNKLISVVNSVAYLPAMAKVGEKGTIATTPTLVIGTANTRTFGAERVFSTPEAAYRRFPLVVYMEVQSEFCMNGSCSVKRDLDLTPMQACAGIWKFKVCEYEPPAVSNGADPRSSERVVLETSDAREFERFFFPYLHEHINRQKRFEEAQFSNCTECKCQTPHGQDLCDRCGVPAPPDPIEVEPCSEEYVTCGTFSGFLDTISMSITALSLTLCVLLYVIARRFMAFIDTLNPFMIFRILYARIAYRVRLAWFWNNPFRRENRHKAVLASSVVVLVLTLLSILRKRSALEASGGVLSREEVSRTLRATNIFNSDRCNPYPIPPRSVTFGSVAGSATSSTVGCDIPNLSSRVVKLRPAGGSTICGGFLIDASHIVTPYHFMKPLLASGKSFDMDIYVSGSSTIIPIPPSNVVVHPNKDICMISLSCKYNVAGADISRYLMEEPYFDSRDSRGFVDDGNVHWVNNQHEIKHSSVTFSFSRIMRSYTIDGETITDALMGVTCPELGKGDCGALLTSSISQNGIKHPMVVGFFVAQDTISGAKYFLPLSRAVYRRLIADVTSVSAVACALGPVQGVDTSELEGHQLKHSPFAWYKEDCMPKGRWIGRFKDSQVGCSRTTVRAHPDVQFWNNYGVFSDTSGPQLGDWRLRRVALDKFPTNSLGMPPGGLMRIGAWLSADIIARLNVVRWDKEKNGKGTEEFDLSRLNAREALDGCKAVTNRCLKRLNELNMYTSAGYPFNKSKKDMMVSVGSQVVKWGTREDGRELPIPDDIMGRVADMEARLRSGLASGAVFNAIEKDEPLANAKVLAGKVRIIYASPVDFTLLTRSVFGPLVNLMSTYPHIFRCWVGTNAESKEWKALYDEVLRHPYAFGCDYSGYDTKAVSYWPLVATYDLMVSILREYGGDWELGQLIGADMLFPIVNFFGEGYIFEGFNPSGNSITTQVNSLANLIMMSYIFAEHKLGDEVSVMAATDEELSAIFSEFAMGTYGDDNIVSHTTSTFTFSACKERFAFYGITITPPLKDGVDYDFIPLSKLTFLKRYFVHASKFGLANDVMLAPLESSTIARLCCVGKNEGVLSGEDLLARNRAILGFLVNEGPVCYNKWLPIIIENTKLANFSPECAGYRSFEDLFFDRYGEYPEYLSCGPQDYDKDSDSWCRVWPDFCQPGPTLE